MYTTSDRRVFIARCESYDGERVKKALKACFDAFDILSGVYEKNVLIKANLLTAHRPEKAATTHPEVAAAAAELLFEAGAASVTIGDSPGGVFDEAALKTVYRVTGMIKAASKSGAALNTDFSECSVPAKGGAEIVRMFRFASFITKADVVINIAKLKTHTYMRMTGAVKNNYGAIPGLYKAKFHAQIPNRDDFAKMLCDLCDTVAPSFSIIDGIVGMEGMGPGTGKPKPAKVLIAAENPYAADMAAAAVIGLGKNRIPVLVEGIKRGYIPENESGLRVSGASIKSVGVRFEPPPMLNNSGVLALLPGRLRAPLNRFIEPFPIVDIKTCVGCGACAEACPRQTIRIVRKKAVINHKNCIKCYCCQELCKHKAIALKRRFLMPD
jgi:uncharacterized protein (DUF362 family)/NAD-dependent dihydropyrimidine dehydrogenase PreA subunit